MSLVKKQHYVPQSYLRNFGFLKKEKSKNIWYTHVKFENSKVHSTNIENLCNERFLYDVENFDLPEKQIIEKFYSKSIDSYFPLITEFCKDSKQQTLSTEMREMMITCCLSLIFRHPHFIDSHPHFLEEDKIVEKDNKKINYSKIKRVSAHMQNFQKLIVAKMNDGIAVSFCDIKTEFLTNDNPILISNGSSNLSSFFDPSSILYLTLTPKICITFTPTNETLLTGTFQKSLMSIDQTYLLNKRIDVQSERVLIGTEFGLENYLKDKEFYKKKENQEELLERCKTHTEISEKALKIAHDKGITSDELDKFIEEKILESPSLKDNISFMQIRLQMHLIKQQKGKADKQKQNE